MCGGSGGKSGGGASSNFDKFEGLAADYEKEIAHNSNLLSAALKASREGRQADKERLTNAVQEHNKIVKAKSTKLNAMAKKVVASLPKDASKNPKLVEKYNRMTDRLSQRGRNALVSEHYEQNKLF